MDQRLQQFNARLAAAGTKAFGTMWTFYCFAVFGLAPVIDPAHQTTYLYWSNVIQLVSLPMLMVGTTRAHGQSPTAEHAALDRVTECTHGTTGLEGA